MLSFICSEINTLPLFTTYDYPLIKIAIYIQIYFEKYWVLSLTTALVFFSELNIT